MFPAVLEVDNRSDDFLDGVADDLPELVVPRAPPAGVKPVRGVNIVLPTDLSVSDSLVTSFLRSLRSFRSRCFPGCFRCFDFSDFLSGAEITEEDDFYSLATLY